MLTAKKNGVEKLLLRFFSLLKMSATSGSVLGHVRLAIESQNFESTSALYKELSDKVERTRLFSDEQCDTLCRHKSVEVFIHAEKKQP